MQAIVPPPELWKLVWQSLSLILAPHTRQHMQEIGTAWRGLASARAAWPAPLPLIQELFGHIDILQLLSNKHHIFHK